MLQIEIAAMNGADTWERALDGAWRAARASAPEAAPPVPEAAAEAPPATP